MVRSVFFWNRRDPVDWANHKAKNQTKMTISEYGEICVNPSYRNGCKSSEKISWMIEFLNTETHKPVPLMNYLESLSLREVRICETQLKLTSRNVIGVVTPLVRGGAQVLHGDQVVELNVLLEVHEKEEVGADGEGLIEVESGE